MSLPPLPPTPHYGYGYDWMDDLEGGWFPVASWGSDGWDLGDWPLVCVVHYDGQAFGVATYVEGDVEVQEFSTKEERDKATGVIAVFYWRHYQTPTAPRTVNDPRVGPYRS